ncbi:HTH domain-containing protein [Haloarcula salinisoli]|uniref:Uncharacterized protein n=1 Tax=Haloarcula salinisoli TaxID=2487746 RepID=A0A8J7YGQ4_9EURY|nr:HTH domain-containing protein [Halomicroarcula salinisoli]MBX0303063.1 hypothetical protein [Halomicroarcula salinisoli]
MRADDATDPTLDALLPPTDSDLTATVFVHSLGPAECKSDQDQLVTELASLTERSVLDDLDLVVWGNSICTASPLTEVGNGQRILDAIGEFYDLAANSELSIAPFFNVSTVTTEYNPDAFSRIVPPSRAVAIYEAGELAAVFPCLLDGTAYTPENLVSHLARERTGETGAVVLDESV